MKFGLLYNVPGQLIMLLHVMISIRCAYKLTQMLDWQIRKQLYPEITTVLCDLTVNTTETNGRF